MNRLEGELLGCVLSDGHLQYKHRYAISFHIGHKLFADYIEFLIKKKYGINPTYFTSLDKKYNKNTYFIRLYGLKYYNEYDELYNQFIKERPNEINEFQKGIIQGYFYGNGCLAYAYYKKNNKTYKLLTFTDNDHNIIQSLEYRLKLLGIEGGRYYKQPNYTRITYYKQSMINIFIKLFKQKFWKQTRII